MATAGGAKDAGPLKRKATEDLDIGIPKSQKQLPVVRPDGTPSGSISAPVPYRGTARPDAPKQPTKLTPKPQVGSSSTASTIKIEKKSAPAPNNAPPAAAPPANTAAPKKGSYAEIMARAKAAAAKETLASAGTIKHKQTEKLSRKERLALQEAAKAKGKAGTLGGKNKVGERIQVSDRSRTGSSEAAARKPGEPVKEKRKPVDLGYKGTMRPVSAEPQYKGTMGLARPGQTRRPVSKASRAPARGPRYASYSEEEEEDDYESDVSSDMEAGVFDVDQEEAEALKVARKEDAREAAAEAEHRRQKAERKKMLEKMNAERAKKRSY